MYSDTSITSKAARRKQFFFELAVLQLKLQDRQKAESQEKNSGFFYPGSRSLTLPVSFPQPLFLCNSPSFKLKEIPYNINHKDSLQGQNTKLFLSFFHTLPYVLHNPFITPEKKVLITNF